MQKRKHRMWRWLTAGVCVAGLAGAGGCGRATDETVIRIWAHQGQEAENQALRAIVAAFNTAHAGQGLEAAIVFFPDHQYAERVAAGAAAGDLPDIMDLDGPTVAQFVAVDLLAPLDPYFTAEELNDFLPTIREQGTIGGTVYALGAFDSALALYYDRDMLRQAGVTPPPEDTPWTWDQFLAACAQLKAAGMDPVALHLHESADEWYTYAFSPVIWSAGGALIDAPNNRVEGVLNAPVNVAALTRWQMLFKQDFANSAPIDPNPFGRGKTAMDWTGHWMARAHLEQKGARLGVAPLPVLGATPAAACGSWAWALLTTARNPDQAARFLRWVLSSEQGVIPIVRANGAIPARLSAFPAFPEYDEPPYRLFKTLLTQSGRPRPKTPHYAALTRNVAEALRDIAQGAEVKEVLDRAAAQMQAVLER